MKAPSWKITLRAIAFLVWFVSIVWLIREPGYEPLIGFLTGTASFLLSFKAGDEPITKVPSSAISPEQQARNRRNMLQLVWNTWIEGYLEKSLYNEVLIELGMETRPGALDYPWDMVVEMPNREPEPILPGTKMLDIFDRANGALLILGEPGSGKTTMLLELARQAIRRAEADTIQPIPVVLNLSSWTPKQSLADWIVSELKSKYYVSPKIGQQWVDSDELLLLLDGFDEVKSEKREACVQAINDFRSEHNISLAVCSRKREYNEIKTQLHVHEAVFILPLTNQQLDEYLQVVGVGHTGVDRMLKRDQELQNLARKPLILSILMLAYQNASDDDLRELEGSREFYDHLFSVYIAKMFKHRGKKQRYTPEKTQAWLSWLAFEMEERKHTLFLPEYIQPSWLQYSNRKRGLIFGLIVGLIFGLIFGLIDGLFGGLIVGSIGESIGGPIGKPIDSLIRILIYGMIGGPIGGPIDLLTRILMYGLILGPILGPILGLFDSEPTDKVIWSWKRAVYWLIYKQSHWLIYGLIAILITGLISLLSVGTIAGLIEGLKYGLFTWLIVWLIVGLFGALRGGLSWIRIEERSNPGEGIRTSLNHCLIILLIVGLTVWLIVGLTIWLIGGLEVRQIGGLIIGLNAGLFLGVIFGLRSGGDFIIRHFTSRWLLYRSGHIPWNLVAFLDYCTDRIFLRRVGGGYIFIHRMLMEHFAEMYQETVSQKE